MRPLAPKTRLFSILAGGSLIILLLIVVPPRLPANGLAWDFVMSLGYVSAALFLVIPLMSTRVWFSVGGSAEEVRPVLAFHRTLSYLALAYLLAHVIGTIIIDPIVIEYLKPSAPWGMLAALIASILILLVLIQSDYRIALKLPYMRWYAWHAGASIVVVLGIFYHILEAGYFTFSVVERIVLAVLSILASLMLFFQAKRYRPCDEVSHINFQDGELPAWRLVAYASLVATILLFIDSMPDSGGRAELQSLQCLIGEC